MQYVAKYIFSVFSEISGGIQQPNTEINGENQTWWNN